MTEIFKPHPFEPESFLLRTKYFHISGLRRQEQTASRFHTVSGGRDSSVVQSAMFLRFPKGFVQFS
jgi:hypothetical protein